MTVIFVLVHIVCLTWPISKIPEIPFPAQSKYLNFEYSNFKSEIKYNSKPLIQFEFKLNFESS